MSEPPESTGSTSTPPAPTTFGRKESFSALDTLALVREVRALGRAWFDKAYDLPEGTLLVTFRVQGKGKWELRVVPGKFALLRPASQDRPDEPGRLGSDLRRLLTGAPLLSVAQPEGERLIELAFGRGGEEVPSVLALELFGKGNVLAVRAGRLAAVLHVQAWKDRRIRPGEPYRRPPSRKDPFQMSAGEVLGILNRSRTDRVSTLAARMGLGGPLAEEVLARAKFSPSEPASERASEAADAIARALQGLRDDVADPPQGYLYRPSSGGEAFDATPFPCHRWREDGRLTEEHRERYSEAAAAVLADQAPQAPAPEDQERARLRVRRESLLRLRTQQLAQVELLKAEMERDRSAADLLLSHYEEAERAVETARASAPDDVEVEISVEGRGLRVAAWRPLRESAQALYEESKRRLPKLRGAEEALAQTEGLLRKVQAEEAGAHRPSSPRAPGTTSAGDPGAAPEAPLRPGRLPRRKHFWFEKAPRWFVSSEGLPVVGGRDARSNDALVKRYLKERDVYIHADIQGAASVVVKSPPPGQGEVGDRTLRQACQWGAACSKAWRAGLASADAFWVRGDQVSKAGASGEFVARGAWVIHGTKNLLRDLPLELTLGLVAHEGEMLLQCAPPGAFERQGCRPLWRLRPGDERDRERLERELAQDLGITRERLQGLLPPGGVSAERA